MHKEIKRLAAEAVRLQNKLDMEATLHQIMDLCDLKARNAGCCGECLTDGPIAAGDVLVAADGQEFKVESVVSDAPAEQKKSRAKVAK